MNKLIRGLLLACGLGLAACSYSSHYVPIEQAVYPPTDPRHIVVSSQKDLRTAHKKIGAVAAMVWGDGEDARERLQVEAARVGANAIIGLRVEKAFFRTSASGTAVFIYR